jgi:TonB family protein
MRSFVVLVAVIAGVSAPSAAQELVPPDRVVAPRVLKEVKPDYTLAARAEGIEGTVTMECTVLPDGTTTDGRILVSLHPELDKEALRSLADWRFAPGTKGGNPVPVSVKIEMTFTLAADRTAHRGPAIDAPEVLRPGNGVTTPVLVHEVKPSYVPEAMRARVQGSVKLECVVLPDGTVGDVRVVQRLHPQLDGESVRKMQEWTFKPGTKDGVAVPVRIEVEMTFAIGSGPARKSGQQD